MDMLQLHGEALETPLVPYHEFLLRYSSSAKVVYGFVEGKQDPCYYRSFIEHSIPDDWSVELWPVGRKTWVYQLHSSINWNRYPRNRVCFFADRDFDDLLAEERPTDLNIYVTDDYSIENSLTNRNTCLRALTEVYSLANVPHAELEAVCDLFDMQYERFLLAMLDVTVWLLIWTRSGRIAHFGNIRMNDLFSVSRGILQPKVHPGDFPTLTDYLHSRCNVPLDATVRTDAVQAELHVDRAYRRVVRGKFAVWFLVEFCGSVYENAPAFFSSLAAPPKMHVNISPSNVSVVIGSRGRIPPTLRVFLADTFGDYIHTFHTSVRPLATIK